MMKKGRKKKVEEKQRERKGYLQRRAKHIRAICFAFAKFIKPHGSRRPVILFFAT